MNVLDALLIISECWLNSTCEKFDVHELTSVEVGVYGTIYFGTCDGNQYRIRRSSCFVEKYDECKGYVRL